MRAIASGVSAGSSLAIASHLLSLLETPPLDLLTAYNQPLVCSWDPSSFLAGLSCGVLLVLVVQSFVTLRWAFVAFVRLHLSDGVEAKGGATGGKQLYKLL